MKEQHQNGKLVESAQNTMVMVTVVYILVEQSEPANIFNIEISTSHMPIPAALIKLYTLITCY